MNAIKIAELAGVSKSTVYRALNGEKIKDSTKKRIMAVMKENNMADTLSGNGFSQQIVKLVALVTDKAERNCPSSSIELIKNKFFSNGFTVIDVLADNISENSNEAERLVSGVNFHGYVFIGAEVCEKNKAFIRKASEKRPVILIHSVMEGKNIYNITTDSENVTSSVISSLITNFGHKKLLCCMPESSIKTAHGQTLVADVQNALKANGKSADSCTFVRSSDLISQVSDCITEWLKQDSSITAVIAQDEISAAGTMRAAERLGLRVPEDLSIIGYQNSDSVSSYVKNISCINTKSETAADMALMLMVAAINGRNVAHSIKIPCTYSERHSAASAKVRSHTYITSAIISSFVSA